MSELLLYVILCSIGWLLVRKTIQVSRCIYHLNQEQSLHSRFDSNLDSLILKDEKELIHHTIQTDHPMTEKEKILPHLLTEKIECAGHILDYEEYELSKQNANDTVLMQNIIDNYLSTETLKLFQEKVLDIIPEKVREAELVSFDSHDKSWREFISQEKEDGQQQNFEGIVADLTALDKGSEYERNSGSLER